MKTQRLLLITFVTILLFVVTTQSSSVRAESSIQNGVSYAAWWAGEYSTPDADFSLENLAATGADWLSLIVTGYQDTITSTTIVFTPPRTPTDDDLIHVITQAHSLGLKVMLKPHVDLSNDPTHWRGEIGDGFTNEGEWQAWFASYHAFIEHYADLAQTYGAEQFCAGCELWGTAHREDNWRTVIAAVRNHYDGPITYAANHSGEEELITWWDAVDYIGVDAYYPLTEKDDPTLAELEEAWIPHVAILSGLASTWGKSILLTEIGYRSQDGTNQHPWDWQISGTIDLQEQADTYQAAFESVYNQPWFAGMFWWSWDTDPFAGGPCDDGYTPHDKPAEDILREWYGVLPRPTSSLPLQPDYSRTMDIYTDELGSDWEDWSWNATPPNLAASDQVYSGTKSISVTLTAWSALSFWHPSFDSSPYYWLEFYVRASSPGTQLWAFFFDENGDELRKCPVDNCRYIEDGTIDVGVWKQVRIPLSDLNAADRSLTRVAIQDRSGNGTVEFWVDEMRLVAATLIGDVSGDMAISAYDAALILQYVVGLINRFPVQDMISPSVAVPRNYTMKMPEQSAKAGDKIYIPAIINDATGLTAGGVTLKYDATVLKATKVLVGVSSYSAYSEANTNIDGEVRFAFATTKPMNGHSNLFVVEFEVLPHTEGKTSRLILDSVSLSNSLTITKINGIVTIPPSRSALLQNYPNPFNPETWIPFKLASCSPATISIYNIKGQLIRTINPGNQKAGAYIGKNKAAYWDGKDSSGNQVSSGLYFYSLQAGDFRAIRRMAIVK